MWLSSDTELIFIPRNNFGIINLTHPHFFRRQQATYARGGLQKYTELHGTTFAQSFLGHDEFKISEILKSHDWSRIPKFPCKAARSRSETERPRAGELEMAQTTAKNGDVFFSRSLLPTPLRNLFWTFQIFSIFPLVNPPFLGIRESTVFFLRGQSVNPRNVAGTNDSRPPQDCAGERWTRRWNLTWAQVRLLDLGNMCSCWLVYVIHPGLNNSNNIYLESKGLNVFRSFDSCCSNSFHQSLSLLPKKPWRCASLASPWPWAWRGPSCFLSSQWILMSWSAWWRKRVSLRAKTLPCPLTCQARRFATAVWSSTQVGIYHHWHPGKIGSCGTEHEKICGLLTATLTISTEMILDNSKPSKLASNSVWDWL